MSNAFTIEKKPDTPKAKNASKKNSSPLMNLINGKPLGIMEWFVDAINKAPSQHRFNMTVGGFLGLSLGYELGNALTGIQLNKGTPWGKDSILLPGLKHLHGTMPYNPYSDETSHRIMYVLHALIPVICGAIGTGMASKLHFREEYEQAKKAKFIDEYELKSSAAQSDAWLPATLVSASFSSISGLDIFPLTNYNFTLGQRFLPISGRKVALPGLGKFFSNNETLYPYGPAKLRDYMVQYAVNNPEADPTQLPQMAKGILKSWFAKTTPEQINEFVNEVHKIRDHYYKIGGIPEEDKKELEDELKKRFKGAGLEETLEKIGLDPAKATLGAHGMTTTLAKTLGGRKTINKISKEYKKEYLQRREERLANQDSAAPAHAEKSEQSEGKSHSTPAGEVETIISGKEPERPDNMVSFAQAQKAKADKQAAKNNAYAV